MRQKVADHCGGFRRWNNKERKTVVWPNEAGFAPKALHELEVEPEDAAEFDAVWQC
jgi:hypothetical protein